MAGKRPDWWETIKEANTALSILQRFFPGAAMTALVGYGTYAWARFTHLAGVEQFVLTLAAVALVLDIWCAFVVLWPYLTLRIDVGLSAHITPASEVVICVTNHGSEALFSAKAIVSFTTHDKSPFQLPWQDSKEKEVSISKGDSANLLVASMCDAKSNELYQMTIWQLLSEKRAEFCLALWNVKPDEVLPNRILKVTVRSRDKRGSVSRCFLVSPKHYSGPLQVISFSPAEGELFTF